MEVDGGKLMLKVSGNRDTCPRITEKIPHKPLLTPQTRGAKSDLNSHCIVSTKDLGRKCPLFPPVFTD